MMVLKYHVQKLMHVAIYLLQRANSGKAQTEMTFKMVLEFFMLLVREKTCRSLLVP